MQDAHAVRTPQDFVRFFVVAESDVSGRDEQIEGIVLIDIQISVLSFFLRRGDDLDGESGKLATWIWTIHFAAGF